MTPDEYSLKALRTESIDFEAILERLKDPQLIRLLHAVSGIVTEAGELQDALKKHIFYGKDLDLVNVEEELADLSWYMCPAMDAVSKLFEHLGISRVVSWGSIWDMVIKKLEVRYPNGFSEKDAVERNLDKEREILEEGTDAGTARMDRGTNYFGR
jgi:NTP pyrophosphatase (non-canonical NTP hydrolase)